MRSYGEYCAVARTLDLLGDRWTLLIIRELAIRPSRYTDLRDGLPGIATNLLADRLRALHAAGVIAAEAAPPPVATTLYSLTDWGDELRPILLALGRWGSTRLMAGAKGSDAFRSRWAGIAMEAAYSEVDLAGLEPVTILIDAGGDPALVTITPYGFRTDTAAPGTDADVELRTDPEATVALLTGRLQTGDLDPDRQARVRASQEGLRRFAALTSRASTPLESNWSEPTAHRSPSTSPAPRRP